jgi:hypothetical protein
VALQLKGGLDEASTLIDAIHRECSLCDLFRALIVFVEGEQEALARVTVLGAMLVDTFNRLAQDVPINSVWAVFFRGVLLTLTYVKGETTKIRNFIEEPVRESAQLTILLDVTDGVEG